MIITERTPYEDYVQQERVASDETAAQIHAAACRYYKQYAELTIDEFWGLMAGDFSLLGDTTKPSVLQIYWQRGFEEFCKTLTKTLERLVIPENPNKEAEIQRGCVEMSAQEGMLIFVRSYFGLPSFYAAGKRTMGEYITARKDDFNKTMTKRNFEALQMRELKTKRHKK